MDFPTIPNERPDPWFEGHISESAQAIVVAPIECVEDLNSVDFGPTSVVDGGGSLTDETWYAVKATYETGPVTYLACIDAVRAD